MSRTKLRATLLAATAAIGVLALTLTGCGVQSTGVHVAMSAPISAVTAKPSASAPAAGSGFPVQLFLTYRNNQLIQVTRYVSDRPNETTILAELAKPLTKNESDNGYLTDVPTDLILQPSGRLAHEYVGKSQTPLNPAGSLQIICSLDVYWNLHPDNRQPSTQLIVNGKTIPFDDCPNYTRTLTDQPAGAFPTAVKTAAPSAVPGSTKTP
jgi:hypothetical protein